MNNPTGTKRKGRSATSGLVRTTAATNVIEHVPLASLRPARINDTVYKPVDPDDPATLCLAASIREKGLLEPIVVTHDGFIVSGHRRRVAAGVAGLETVPVRRHPIWSTDPDFETVLVTFNQQREKTIAEKIREEVIRTSPEDAHNMLLAHRKLEANRSHNRVELAGLRILESGAAARRSVISDAKQEMLKAALGVFEKYEDFWPLTLRQVHYRLLGKGVRRNTTKPPTYTDGKGATRNNVYVNDQACYKDLSDLLTRARLAGELDMAAMHDPTRPRTTWRQWDGVAGYMREQLDEFLCGYKRDLLQSQPAYVELVVEKITAQEIAERAAARYHVPVGVGRGYSSVTALDETADRFRASGKGQFVLLIAGDFDPEGEDICRTWVACLRDEHGVEDITAVKVGVNPSQVEKYNLAPLPMKETSSRAAGFEEKHGTSVYELEAFEPDVLQQVITDAIRGVLDLDLFRQEQQTESEEARRLMAVRSQFQAMVKDLDLGA